MKFEKTTEDLSDIGDFKKAPDFKEKLRTVKDCELWELIEFQKFKWDGPSGTVLI